MIDKSKQYKTRDGREVRIYATDGGGYQPVHGAIKINGQWDCNQWTEHGNHYVEIDESIHDLIEVKPRIQREVWVNVYRENAGGIYCQKEEADAFARPDRIACVRLTIDCAEGEGL